LTRAGFRCFLEAFTMLDPFRKCWALLPPRLRWGTLGIFLLINLHAVAQLAMVASILPFLQAIADPAGAARFAPIWERVRGLLGPMEDVTWLLLLGSLVVVAVLFANAVGAIHSVLLARFSSRLNSHLSSALLRSHLLRPYPFYLNRSSSEFLTSIFSEVYLVTQGFLQTAMMGLSRLLTVLALGGLLLLLSPWVTLAAGIFFAGSYTGVYLILRRRLAAAGRGRAECERLRYKAVSEAFGTIKELKVLRREPNFIEAFDAPSRQYFRYLERVQLFAQLPRNIIETIAFAGMVGIAMLLLQRHGGMAGALPVLGLFAVAGYRLLPAIQGLYQAYSQLRYHRTSVETLYRECEPLLQNGRILALQEQVAERAAGTDRLPLKTAIELQKVRFQYPGAARPSLQEIDLVIPARSRIGLCGRSGAGKTTLADILLGLLQPQAGSMRVDGVELNEPNSASWQRNCGYVPQQIYLTDDTIRRNIAFGIRPSEIDDGRVREAARLANLHLFVEQELPFGYETEVGERGIRLSGGQRQRIGIARALYHDPEVILLDEATSSLDTETERAILEAVESLAGKKTIIMIAHRLSTIRHADLIVMIENGSVTATGTFEELFSESHGFRQLAEA
jgi:ATP-binding cassette, subfamily B, bacterial PglK